MTDFTVDEIFEAGKSKRPRSCSRPLLDGLLRPELGGDAGAMSGVADEEVDHVLCKVHLMAEARHEVVSMELSSDWTLLVKPHQQD